MSAVVKYSRQLKIAQGGKLLRYIMAASEVRRTVPLGATFAARVIVDVQQAPRPDYRQVAFCRISDASPGTAQQLLDGSDSVLLRWSTLKRVVVHGILDPDAAVQERWATVISVVDFDALTTLLVFGEEIPHPELEETASQWRNFLGVRVPTAPGITIRKLAEATAS